ncbi:hypothetical protein NMG60_11022510 [Bertholletia excelsa]
MIALDGDLYRALMSGNEKKVIELCKRVLEGPMHKLTIHEDTVLHMATYSKQKDLVLNLLRQWPEAKTNKLTTKNDTGNTILHEAATSNRLVPAAGEMLRRAPELLELKNLMGENALFRAARYGKMQMFKFLDEKFNECLASEGGVLEERREKFYQRNDETTILHISVLTEHFGVSTEDEPPMEEGRISNPGKVLTSI